MASGIVDPPRVGIASLDDGLTAPFDVFVQSLAAVARTRAGEDAGAIGEWLDRLLPQTRELVRSPDMARVVADLAADATERMLLVQLQEEMWFYVWMYRSAAPDLQQYVPERLQVRFGNSMRDAADEEAIDNAETVIGSINKFIDKLPGPLKKFLHAILEVMKLTRGIT
ncbi:MAG: hypothetical protein H3C62_09395 [Gemmatimonadaceae bacterium]|nr:hypothetical protein [Gemmatimonadaceae bacterium]